MKKISKIVVVSEIMIKEYTEWITEENIFKIFNVCEPIISRSEVKNYNNDKTNILSISFISKDKGIFVLLEAFRNLAKKYNNINLIICGSFLNQLEDDKKNFLKLIKNEEIINKIEYMGVVNGENKKKVFLDSDIFVLPTLRDSFGIVNIEAMSAGLPVISTYQGAIPEYIEDGVNGFLIRDVTSEELEKKLEILINNKSLIEEIGLRNRDKFFRLFSKNIFIEEWINVIKLN